MSFFHKKKTIGNIVEGALLDKATKFAGIRTDMIVEDAMAVAISYLTSVYNQSVADIPMRRMSEDFYYETADRINKDLMSGIVRTVDILDFRKNPEGEYVFRLSDYDNSIKYAVRSITYEGVLYVSGKYGNGKRMSTFIESRIGCFTFINDARMGWILAAYDDLGPVQ